MSIAVERVEIQVVGAEQGERAIAGVNAELGRTDAAAATAGRGLQSVEAAAKNAGTGATQAGGMFSTLNGVVKSGGDAFKKATDGVEALTGSIARITAAVGVVVLVFDALSAVASAVSTALGENNDQLAALTDESVKARTGLKDLTSQIDAYARSVGQANADLLTFGERQRALAEIVNGGGAQTFEALGQRAEALAEQIAETKKLLTFAPEGSALATDLQRRLAAQQEEAAILERSQRGIRRRQTNDAAVQSFIADGGAGTDETLNRIGTGSGGGARRPAGDPRSVLVTPTGPLPFWAANADQVRADGVAAQEGANYRAGQATLAAIGGAAQSAADQATAAIKSSKDAVAGGLFDTEYLKQLGDQVDFTFGSFGRGLAQSTAAAILFGGSFKTIANEALKGLALQAGTEAVFQTARGFSLLANPLTAPFAEFAFTSAAIFAGIATGAAGGAALTGGLRGRGAGGGGASSGGRGGATALPEVGRSERPTPQVVEATFVLGIDGEQVFRGVLRANDRREGSRSERRFATAA